jgi:hypothetical protein
MDSADRLRQLINRYSPDALASLDQAAAEADRLMAEAPEGMIDETIRACLADVDQGISVPIEVFTMIQVLAILGLEWRLSTMLEIRECDE